MTEPMPPGAGAYVRALVDDPTVITTPDVPDPGWAGTDDGCTSSAKIALSTAAWRCELDAGHVARGEPHILTLTWFDPVDEPDCDTCADTGQVAGEPCPDNCDRARFLAGEHVPPDETDQLRALTAQPTLGGWSAPDD